MSILFLRLVMMRVFFRLELRHFLIGMGAGQTQMPRPYLQSAAFLRKGLQEAMGMLGAVAHGHRAQRPHTCKHFSADLRFGHRKRRGARILEDIPDVVMARAMIRQDACRP